MRIEVVTHVRRPLAEVYAWCTDYRETDPELSRVGLRGRRVLGRAAGMVELEDRGVLGLPLTAHYLVRLHPPDRWEADVSSRMGTGHNEYRLFAEAGGTRPEITFDLRPRGPYRPPAALSRKMLERRLSHLWDDLGRAMEAGR